MKPRKLKAHTFEEVLESAKRKQEEIDAMSPEEREAMERRTEEILKKFGGCGPSVFMVGGKRS